MFSDLEFRIINRKRWLNAYCHSNSRDRKIISFLLLVSYVRQSNQYVRISINTIVKVVAKWLKIDTSGDYYEPKCAIKNILKSLVNSDLLECENLGTSKWVNSNTYVGNDTDTKNTSGNHDGLTVVSHKDDSGHISTHYIFG